MDKVGEENNDPDARPVDTYEAGRWKSEGNSGQITSVIMNVDGTEYIRDIQDLSEHSNGFKITIKDEENGIPNIGAIYFSNDGKIEFEPTPDLRLLPEGESLSADFTYTVDHGDNTTAHSLNMSITGNGAAATSISINNGVPVTLESSVENDYKIGKITITDDVDGFVYNGNDRWEVFEQISDDPLKASTAFHIIESEGEYYLAVADSTQLADMEGSVDLVLALTDEGEIIEQPVTANVINNVINYDVLEIVWDGTNKSLSDYINDKGDGIEEVRLFNTRLSFTASDIIDITDDDNELYISYGGDLSSIYDPSNQNWSYEGTFSKDGVDWTRASTTLNETLVNVYFDSRFFEVSEV